MDAVRETFWHLIGGFVEVYEMPVVFLGHLSDGREFVVIDDAVADAEHEFVCLGRQGNNDARLGGKGFKLFGYGFKTVGQTIGIELVTFFAVVGA